MTESKCNDSLSWGPGKRNPMCNTHGFKYEWKSSLGLWMGEHQADVKVCLGCIMVARAMVRSWIDRAKEARYERNLRNR